MEENKPLRQIWREASRGEKWRYVLAAIALVWIVLQLLFFPSTH